MASPPPLSTVSESELWIRSFFPRNHQRVSTTIVPVSPEANDHWCFRLLVSSAAGGRRMGTSRGQKPPASAEPSVKKRLRPSPCVTFYGHARRDAASREGPPASTLLSVVHLSRSADVIDCRSSTFACGASPSLIGSVVEAETDSLWFEPTLAWRCTKCSLIKTVTFPSASLPLCRPITTASVFSCY